MPDLLGHLAFARVSRAVPAVARFTATPGLSAVFYLGAAWPDLVTRPFHILYPPCHPYVEVLHAPLLQPLWAIAIAALFAPPLRRRVALVLLAGMATHLALDLVQHHLVGGYLWAFPFSFQRTGAGLLWAEDTLLWITPPLCLVAALLEWRAER